MPVFQIKEHVQRPPFRPFSVRLNNGAQDTFSDETKVGAPEDFHIIVYFGKNQAVLSDTESISRSDRSTLNIPKKISFLARPFPLQKYSMNAHSWIGGELLAF